MDREMSLVLFSEIGISETILCHQRGTWMDRSAHRETLEETYRDQGIFADLTL